MDFRKYSWDDFFDFNEETPLNKFTDAVNNLEKIYIGMAAEIAKSNERISDSQQKLVDDAKAVLKSVESVSMAQADGADVMNKSATATGALAAEMKALKDIEAQNAKQIADLKSQLEGLNKVKETSKKFTDAEAGSLVDLKKRLAEAVAEYERMGDATDQVVKDEHLKKVRELSTQYRNASTALNEAKKYSINAAGSYNELAARVAEAKKELKTLGGAFDDSNPRVKELSKFVDEGTKKLKGFDDSISDNTRNVGNYKSALDAVIPGFGGLTSGIESATAAGKTFIASPIGLILLAVAAALGLVASYFQRTDEGGDKLAEILEVISQVLGVILDVAAQAGKVLFDAISEPKELWESFMDLLDDGKKLIEDVFNDPIKYIKAFGDAILTNIINRFKSFGVLFESFEAFFNGQFDVGFKKLADASIQFATGVTDATDKISDGLENMFGGLADSIARAAQLAREIAALEDDADAKRIENIKLRAQIELQQNELILKQKDKLRVSDEERFRALKQEGKLQETLLLAELDVANKLLEASRKRIEIRKLEGDVTDDLKEAEANAIKEVLGLQSRAIQERAARQKREIALVKEVENEILSRIKRERDAQAALDKFLIEDRIRANNQIIANENSTLDEILSAIIRNGDEQQALIQQTRDQQLAVAKETALARIELSDDELSTIYNNEKLSLQQRIEQERAIKEQRLNEDAAFVDEQTRVNGEYFSKIEELNAKTAEAAENNVFKILARDAERLRDSTDTLIAEGLISLNAEFERGEISADEFQRRRQQIQENGQRVSLESQLDYLEEQRLLFEQYGHDTTDLERQIAETRLQLSDATANELLANEQKLQQALSDLRTTAVSTATDFIMGQFEREQMMLDERLTKLQERAELEIALAGDNEEQKAKIKNDFAQQQAQIEAQQAASARRAAVFEKISAVFSIGINTAIAVSKAIAASPLTGGLPFSAIAGALGALQIAAVLAKPIPQYAEGTQYHPGGLALFAEAGAEIVETPSGKMTYFDSPTIGDLPSGSKVYTAEQTRNMMAANGMMAASVGQYINDNERLGNTNDVESLNAQMVNTISEKMESLEHVIKTKKELHINVTKGGVQRAIRDMDGWTEYLNRNYF
jgi:hypothetical protein